MSRIPSELIDISRLQVGMFVELDIGWMSHPFPTSSFRISSPGQIDVLRSLGLKQVRYVPGQSEVAQVPEEDAWSLPRDAAPANPGHAQQAAQDEAFRQKRAALLLAQRRGLALCEHSYHEATLFFKRAADCVDSQPAAVREQSLALINGYLDQIQSLGDSSIRLLGKGAGERAAAHAVNVTVLSLLLGQAMGLARPELLDLGVAAFLHDIGKDRLPERVRLFDKHFSGPEMRVYQNHVEQGVVLARQMGLSEPVQQAIAQHHEMADGSGFPRRLKGENMTLAAKILAVVNRYDSLCNPNGVAGALTPHEAVSSMFVTMKHRFDGAVLSAFIRMMGVYPPGSVIQLMDERYAMVVAANTARPLKPRVIVHDPAVPRGEAVIIDLEYSPEIGIRRGVRPESLPEDSAEYLAPRPRVCYFFEHFDRQEPEPLAA